MRPIPDLKWEPLYLENRAKFMSVVTSKMRLFPLPTVPSEQLFSRLSPRGEHDFEAIAIAGGKDGVEMNECAPCGVCRQVMTEFCDKNFRIILGSPEKISVYTLGEIMPFTFSAKNLFEK